jgi:hypothetical protein
VSLDSRSATAPESVPVIENELPSYRAISAGAVASLLLGLVSILSFADYWFLVAGAAAVVVGALSVRRINRYNDVLTGRGLAQAGIAMGLVFSVSAATIGYVSAMMLERSARGYGRSFAKTLQTGTLAEIAWHRLQPSMRKGKNPETMLTEMAGVQDPSAMEAYLGGLRAIQGRVSQPNQTVRFVEIEASGYERLTPYAFALYELDGPGEDGKDKHEYALAELKSDPELPGLNWYVSDVVYPYTRKSHVLKAAPVDDGHGHGH